MSCKWKHVDNVEGADGELYQILQRVSDGRGSKGGTTQPDIHYWQAGGQEKQLEYFFDDEPTGRTFKSPIFFVAESEQAEQLKPQDKPLFAGLTLKEQVYFRRYGKIEVQ